MGRIFAPKFSAHHHSQFQPNPVPTLLQINWIFDLIKKSCFNKVGYLPGILLYLQTVHEQKRWLQQTFRLHCLRQFPSRPTDWQPFYMHNAKQCTELHFIVKQQLVHWHRGWSDDVYMYMWFFCSFHTVPFLICNNERGDSNFNEYILFLISIYV